MRVLIADDEPVARRVLGELLSECKGVEVVGEAASGPEAVERILKLEPDVALLDLQMPGFDGFQVVRSLRPRSLPAIIFVTAFQQHALEAFDAGAVDYLLKPVRLERLEAALGKARARLAGQRRPEPPAALAKIPAVWARACTCSISVTSWPSRRRAKACTSSPRGENTNRLTRSARSSRGLRRRASGGIHRKTIINTDHIRRISPLSSRRWLLEMSNGMQAIVSRRMAGSIREQTDW